MKKSTSAKLIIGLPAQRNDLRYATGFSAPDAVVFLDTPGQRYLVVPKLEYGRAVRQAKGVRVLTPQDLRMSPKKRRDIHRWAIDLLHFAGVKRVEVHRTFPMVTAGRLRQAGVRIVPAKGMLYPQRSIKTPDEIKKIRGSQEAAVIAMRMALRTLGEAEINTEGYLTVNSKVLTAEELRLQIMKNLLEHRCRGEETIVACGRDAADPHERGSGPLSAREAIVIDIFPQHMEHGYWGDLTRTVVKGQPGPKLVALYRAVKEAQRAALKAIKPRVQVCTVHKAAQQVFEKAGFATGITDGFPQGFIHSTGHGVGLDIHEPPSLGDSTARLREGQVITVEPGLYYRTLGGVRIEDTVVVTKEGWRYLVPLEKKFQL